MTSDQEIREWARAEGIAAPARGRVPQELREQHAAATGDSEGGDNAGLSLVKDEGVPVPPETAPVRPSTVPPADTGEVRPLRPGGGAPARGRFGRKRRPAAGGERPPRKRVSIEEIAADGWALMATFLGSQGLVPTARVLDLQAPVAGAILEDTLRGTLADRLLQPIARNSGKAREISALLGPPVLVSILTVRPDLGERLLPTLKRQIRTWVLIAGPKLKAKERAEKKALEAMGVDSPAALDREVEQMIASLWAPPGMAGMQPEPEEMPDAA